MTNKKQNPRLQYYYLLVKNNLVEKLVSKIVKMNKVTIKNIYQKFYSKKPR